MNKQNVTAKRAGIIAGLAVCFVLVVLIVCYLCTASYYAAHFFPGTVLNGVPVGGLTADEAEDKVAQEVADYILMVRMRDGTKYTITGPQIDYTYVPGTEIKDILESQPQYQWLMLRGGKKEKDLDVSAAYDAAKLTELVSGLDCFREENIKKPQDAKLVETEDGFSLTQEEEGNAPVVSKVQALVADAVDAGQDSLELSDDAYEQPEVRSDDKRLTDCLAAIDAYLDTTVRYDVGSEGEVLDRRTIKNWITVNDDYEVQFDESKVTDYVQYLASKYNTYGDVRTFLTSKGDKVKIGGGDYGWVIDKEKEREQLLSEMGSGRTVAREPVFNQTAKVKSEKNDIGDTYLEIDYTNQHMYYYEKGQLKLQSDVVTGNISQNNGSPDGLFKIVYKQSPATLVGETYESDVHYFMVFAYNVGFHDASWRSEFGGDIYKTSGSHGCINMPLKKAKKLYQMLEAGTPVVAYYREPVELTAENAKISNAYSYVDKEKEEK